MLHRSIVRNLALGFALSVLVFPTAARAGGPPWISVELPGDPTNPASRGAVVLVRAYSCGAPTASQVTATADGIVAGERRTLELRLEPVGPTGVYAVRKQWPSEGVWVLAFRMSIGGDVSTLVTLGPDAASGGAVHAASVQVIGRKTTSSDVDSILRAAATGERVVLAGAQPASTNAFLAGGAGLVALVACSAGVAFGRRRRERGCHGAE
jgi:hypothetical protein